MVDSVEHLADLVGLRQRASFSFDWQAVEGSVGRPLPQDYKTLVETFPQGRFQGFVELIRPGDYGESSLDFLGYYRYRLEDMREWRRGELERFPMPIYPELGGLLPWGRSRRNDLFFWLTDSPDPDHWSIVVSDAEFSRWDVFSGNISSFLEEVVSGRFDGSPYHVDLAARDPWFELPPPVTAPDPRPSGELFWLSHQMWPERPENKFAELTGIISCDPRKVTAVDWPAMERSLGIKLPSDYKQFAQKYGPGTFLDIAIAVPETSAGFDLYTLLDERHQQARNSPQHALEAPVHPEPGGMIAWGRTPDGWTCHWAPVGQDPDGWGVVVVGPHDGGWEYHWGESFSSFLVKYADPHHLGIFVGRDSLRSNQISFNFD
jgi:hypothetical protein